jgi:hypothetical protein
MAYLPMPEDGVGLAASMYTNMCFVSFLEQNGQKLKELLPIKTALNHGPQNRDRTEFARLRLLPALQMSARRIVICA